MKKFAYVTLPEATVHFGSIMPGGAFLLAENVTDEKENQIRVRCDTLRDGKDTPFIANVKIASTSANRKASLEFFKKWVNGEVPSKKEQHAEAARSMAAICAIIAKRKPVAV